MTEDEIVGWHHWWTGVWISSGSWWWTGKPGVLQSIGSQRVGHDWAIELNWTEGPQWDFPGGMRVKGSHADAAVVRDSGSIPASARFPGGGHGNPLQDSCLENPMDRGVWLAIVFRVKQSWIWLKQLSTHTRTSGEGSGNPPQYSCPGSPRDRQAWRATVHGVAKNRTRQSN